MWTLKSFCSHPKYMNNHQFRTDINGLRAYAVVFVVLFHFNVFGFSAGYLGVDVFFVISGYLMTKIIVEKLEHNNFSFVDFLLFWFIFYCFDCFFLVRFFFFLFMWYNINKVILFFFQLGRDGWVDYSVGLLIRCTNSCTEGSNPSLSVYF